jgi:hypothetical protein
VEGFGLLTSLTLTLTLTSVCLTVVPCLKGLEGKGRGKREEGRERGSAAVILCLFIIILYYSLPLETLRLFEEAAAFIIMLASLYPTHPPTTLPRFRFVFLASDPRTSKQELVLMVCRPHRFWSWAQVDKTSKQAFVLMFCVPPLVVPWLGRARRETREVLLLFRGTSYPPSRERASS